MHTFPTAFVEASDFLCSLLHGGESEDELHGGESEDEPHALYVTMDVDLPIQADILKRLIKLHAHLMQSKEPTCFIIKQYCGNDDNNKHVLGLGASLNAASFLQLNVVQHFLVSVLNRLCQYDDARLPLIEGAINPYWLGDMASVKLATKLWLGIAPHPTPDDSCFSSVKMLTGCDINKQTVENILRHTDDAECIALLTCLLATGRLHRVHLTSDVIARYGKLQVLQWAVARGCSLNERTCDSAAVGGFLEILQWLRERGCSGNVFTCAYAAMCGRMNVLQWLKAQGCPWDEMTCRYAVGLKFTYAPKPPNCIH